MNLLSFLILFFNGDAFHQQSIRRELFTEGILVTVAKPGPLAGTNFLSKVRNMRHVPMSFKIPFLYVHINLCCCDVYGIILTSFLLRYLC